MKILDRILSHHRVVLVALLAVIIGLGLGIRHFDVDASAKTLINTRDKDYIYTNDVAARYKVESAVVLVVKPHAPLFSRDSITMIRQLRDTLAQVKGVSSVMSMIELPILNYPGKPFGKTLLESDVHLATAEQLFKTNPLYKDMLVASDGKTTGMQIVIEPGAMNTEEKRHLLLNELRGVIEPYRESATLYLGGLDVIADDMVSFLKKDILVFGGLILLSMVGVLWWIFRRRRWIALALGCCAASAIVMMGVLGHLGLKVTVLSSNFVSLQAILTMSLITHLMVKYQELSKAHPNESQRWLVGQTIQQKFTPSLFAALTTIVGFASLLFSQIVPVMAFGWMMIAGLVVSFVVTFFLFITLMLSMPKMTAHEERAFQFPVTAFGTLMNTHRLKVLFLSVVLMIIGAMGVAQLEVENSFVNYFKKSTDLHKSLVFIDENLGGTTSLSIMLDNAPDTADTDDDDGFDGFEEFDTEESSSPLTLETVEKLAQVHQWLEQRPEVGKVLSLWTTVQVAEQVQGRQLAALELAVLPYVLPRHLRHMLWDSFVHDGGNELRINLRTRDSDPELRRQAFLTTVREELTTQFGIPADRIKLAGDLVLYNNILQQLFQSQIRTLGLMLGILLVMLFILLRNVRLALIALLPNVASVALVLGTMGWVGIPLDLMTITIASITVGIAIDDAIHYIYRFKKEYLKHGDYTQALMNTHNSVGQAMIYTTLTISIGFGVLIFSNFIPNIYFGLLTAMAMAVALIGSLTLMAVCLVVFKPFGTAKR